MSAHMRVSTGRVYLLSSGDEDDLARQIRWDVGVWVE